MALQKTLLESINDVFVINASGLPYYSKCFGGDICRLRPDHALQTGFLAAIYSFAGDFGQKMILEVMFEDSSLIFVKKEMNNAVVLTIFFVSSEGVSKEDQKNLVRQAADAFEKEFIDKIEGPSQIINMNDFEGFSDTLLNLELVSHKPGMDIPLGQKNKPLWKRLFRRE
ncbi:MAG: hypothetical protein ACXAC7_17045 [Candidatus Hodarchaeales archaeon]|jgi:hypothetical protein